MKYDPQLIDISANATQTLLKLITVSAPKDLNEKVIARNDTH